MNELNEFFEWMDENDMGQTSVGFMVHVPDCDHCEEYVDAWMTLAYSQSWKALTN